MRKRGIGFSLIAIIWGFSCGALHAQASHTKPTMAILDLEPSGVESREVRVISAKLRHKINELRRFDLLERQKMKSVLTELNFQLSDCTTDQCYVKVGELLTVQKMVAGQVGKVGTVFTLSARVIDVESGRVEASSFEEIRGGIEDVLTKGVPQLVSNLLGEAVSDGEELIDDPAQILDSADEAYRGEEWEEALRLYERLLEFDPANPIAIQRIGELKPRSDYETWQKDSRRKRDYYVNMARWFMLQGRIQEACNYAFWSLAGDWEWDQGRQLLREILLGCNMGPGECCDEEALFEGLLLTEHYKEELKNRAKAVRDGLLPGVLTFDVSEPGANVRIGEKDIGTSPIPPQVVDAGDYRISVNKDGFLEQSEILTVSPSETTHVVLRLEPEPPPPGVIIVDVSESDASVRIGDEDIGTSPISPQVVDAGDYRVTANKDGFLEQSEQVTVASGDTVRLMLRLKPKPPEPAIIMIEVSEREAIVLLNGQTVGLSPVIPQTVQAGHYRVSARKDGFLARTDSVTVSPGDTTAVTFHLRRATGVVAISSDPEGARVAIDGSFVGTAPLYSLVLPTGRKKAIIEKPQHERWKGYLEVVHGDTLSILATLSPKTQGKALRRSLLLPGWGQRYQDRNLVGWSYTLLQTAALAAAVYGHSAYDAAMSDYDGAKLEYDQAVVGHEAIRERMDEEYRNAQDWRQATNLAFTFAAAVYLWNLAELLIF